MLKRLILASFWIGCLTVIFATGSAFSKAQAHRTFFPHESYVTAPSSPPAPPPRSSRALTADGSSPSLFALPTHPTLIAERTSQEDEPPANSVGMMPRTPFVKPPYREKAY